jgi:hypothetical protein
LFFKARAPTNPSLVSAPSPIHASKVSTEQSANRDDSSMLLDVLPAPNLMEPMRDETETCAIASELLSQLHIAIEQIQLVKKLSTCLLLSERSVCNSANSKNFKMMLVKYRKTFLAL